MSHRPPDAHPGSRFPSYRRAARSSEARRSAAAAALSLALACGGCSTTAGFDDEPLVTGSVPASAQPVLPEGKAPHGIAAGDWLAARRALHEALLGQQRDASVPWENAATGARGTATPIGPARDGGCRDFLIAVVDGKVPDRWISGAACRDGSGTVLSQVRVLGKA